MIRYILLLRYDMIPTYWESLTYQCMIWAVFSCIIQLYKGRYVGMISSARVVQVKSGMI